MKNFLLILSLSFVIIGGGGMGTSFAASEEELKVSSPQVSLSLSPERGSWRENEPFEVRVLLEAPQPITSLQASILYDPSRLGVVKIVKENTALVYWWKSDFRSDARAGEILLQASAPTPGVQGTNIPIATITFQPKANGLAALLVSPASLALTATDLNILNSSRVGAIFGIGAVFPKSPSFVFTSDLREGSQGPDVKAFQQYLNSRGFTVAQTGAGSPGQETEYFGPRTREALIRFQEANASQILAPLGLTNGTGYFGSSTRAFIALLSSE